MSDPLGFVVKALWAQGEHAKNKLVHGEEEANRIRSEKAAKQDRKNRGKAAFMGWAVGIMMTVFFLLFSGGAPPALLAALFLGPLCGVISRYLFLFGAYNPYK